MLESGGRICIRNIAAHVKKAQQQTGVKVTSEMEAECQDVNIIHALYISFDYKKLCPSVLPKIHLAQKITWA